MVVYISPSNAKHLLGLFCNSSNNFHCSHVTLSSSKNVNMVEWLVLLRSEIPSGMCAKLRTVAASNNRDHPTRSLNYCLFAPHTYIFVLRAHPVCGESHNQPIATGEVATVSMPVVRLFFGSALTTSFGLACRGYTFDRSAYNVLFLKFRDYFSGF